MGDFKEEYLLSRQEYGVLFPYVTKDEVQQVYWNGRSLWIEDAGQGRYVAKERLTDGFVNRFALLMSNRCGCLFNPTHPVFEWENGVFYLQMLHESVAGAGTTLLLKKKDRPHRPDARSLVESGFCDESAVALLKDIIREEKSFLIYGPADCSKTALLRFMTRYIPPEKRIISIEGEHHSDIASLNPDKDVTELKSYGTVPDGQLQKVCRGIRPRWILGIIHEGRLVCDMVEVIDRMSARSGICVTAGTAEEVIDNLFPWEQDVNVNRIRSTLHRVFPVWIGVDEEGIGRITGYEKNRAVVIYDRTRERKSGE